MSAMITKEQPTSFPTALPVRLDLPATGPADHCMCKNRLQEYTQRTGKALPIYQILNEGSQHAPKFRSYVWVDGIQYASPDTFSIKKSAEQDVARVALLSISEKIKNEGYHLIRGDTVFCKSILMEYAVKMHLEKPTYSTVQSKGLHPSFVCSSVFNGVSYTGDVGRNKKEAEQLAARAVILSFLESGTAAVISEIITSKFKLYAALNKTKDLKSHGDIMPMGATTRNDAGSPLVDIDSQPFHEFKKPGVKLPPNSTPLGQSSALDSSNFNERKTLEVDSNTNLPISAISGPSKDQPAGVTVTDRHYNEVKKPRVDNFCGSITTSPASGTQNSSGSFTSSPVSVPQPMPGSTTSLPTSGPQPLSGSITPSPMSVSQILPGSITPPPACASQVLGQPSAIPPHASAPQPLSSTFPPTSVPQVLGQSLPMGSSSSTNNRKKKNKRKVHQLPGMMSMGLFPPHPMTQ